MTRAYDAIDKMRSDVSTDYAGHQPSAVELSRLRSVLHGYRAAASHLADIHQNCRAGNEWLAAEKALFAAAQEEAQAFRRRHPLGRRAA